MGVRLYQPGIGRFLSPDPVLGGNCNDYDYVCGDPVNGFDLSGEVGGKGRHTMGYWRRRHYFYLINKLMRIAENRSLTPRQRSANRSYRNSGTISRVTRYKNPITFKLVDGVSRTLPRISDQLGVAWNAAGVVMKAGGGCAAGVGVGAVGGGAAGAALGGHPVEGAVAGAVGGCVVGGTYRVLAPPGAPRFP